MPVVRMDLQQFAEYARRLGDGHTVKEAAVRGVRSAAMRVVAELVKRTRQAPPANPTWHAPMAATGGAVDTGALARGWQHQDVEGGSEVFNVQSYAPVVEYGRRPGSPMPPFQAIFDWARRKLGQIEATERQAKKLFRQYAAHVVARRAQQEIDRAWLIARSIARRGLRGRFILTAPEFQERIREIAAKEVERELGAVMAGEKDR